MSFSVELRPAPCPTCGHQVAWCWDGMTYNLAPMFHLAGFYEAMKNETGGTGAAREVLLGEGCAPHARPPMTGEELAPLVRQGLDDMIARPEAYRALNPKNGWGTYEGAVEFTRALLAACEKHPGATVRFR